MRDTVIPVDQSNRLLQFHCKMAPHAIVSAIQGREALSDLYEYRLTLHNQHPLDVDSLLHQKATLALKKEARFFCGVVTHVETVFVSPPQWHTYTITLSPALVYLQYQIDSRVFQNKTIFEIIDQLCLEHNIPKPSTSRCQQVYPPIRYCTQYQESCFDFIQRLLSEAGITYGFTHDSFGYTWYLMDNAHSWLPRNETLTLAQGLDGQQNALLDWASHARARPSRLATRDYNYRNPSAPLDTEIALAQLGQGNEFHAYRFPGRYLSQAQGNDQIKRQGAGRIQQHQGQSGRSHCYALMAGGAMVVKLGDSQQTVAITELSIDAEDHSLLPVKPANKGSATYNNTFTVIASTDRYYPPLQPKPVPSGPLTAQVTGIDKHSVHTDDLARVKVQFHWDRYQQWTAGSSCWLRCLQSAAGKHWGTVFLPRVQDEVLVDFVNGDIDQPIVVASAFNALNRPVKNPQSTPYSSGIRSRTSGSSVVEHGHSILFDDHPTRPAVTVKASRDYKQHTWGSEVNDVGQGETIDIKKGNAHYITHSNHCIEASTGMQWSCGSSQITMDSGGISLSSPLISINPSPAPPVAHSWWGDLIQLFHAVKSVVNAVEDDIDHSPLLSAMAGALTAYMSLRQMADVGNMVFGAVEAVGGVFLDECGVGELMQEDAIKREMASGSDLASTMAARTAEKDISAGATEVVEKEPVLPASKLPRNPDDLVAKHGYNDISNPNGLANGHSQFENINNNDTLNFDKGDPEKPGHAGKDHYHRVNPNKTNRHDAYLDKYGNPCRKGSDESHLYSEEN